MWKEQMHWWARGAPQGTVSSPGATGTDSGASCSRGALARDPGDPFQASELLRAHPLRHLLCLEHMGFIAQRWGAWSLVFRVHGYIRRFNLYWYHLSLI